MDDLLELAERCEKATDNDLHLFRQIGFAVFGNFTGYHDGEPQYSVDNLRPELIQFEHLIAHEAWLDAAMMLVPEGWGWSVDSIGLAKTCPDHDGQAPLIESGAATPALALCAAALRSRATQGNG